MRIAFASQKLATKALIAALLTSFAFTTSVAEAKPRKRQQVERKSNSDSDGGRRWRTGQSSIVVDGNTGRVLYQDNADELRHPASVTKVMTLYLLFEQLEAGRLKLDSDLPVSARAASQSPSKLNVRAGSTIEVEDAIKAVVTRSANDVAVVIAEAIGGSESRFAEMMTAKARALGMTRTVYRNASGLPNAEQVTTARDLSILGRAIQDRFPKQYRYFSTRSFTYRGETIGNHNRMLGRIEGVDGIKTGYTRASGFNLLTSVKRDDRYMIAVVLGGRSARSRDDRMAELILDQLPRAYAGRRTAPKLIETAQADTDDAPAPLPIERAVAPLPAPQRLALAADPVITSAVPRPIAHPAPQPAPVAAAAPVAMAAMVAPVPAPVARAAEKPAQRQAPVQQAAAPAPAPAPAPAKPAVQTAQLNTQSNAKPAPGSAEPIQPSGVKTISIQRPVEAASVAMVSFAPPAGVLGYLTPTGMAMGPSQARPQQMERVATNQRAYISDHFEKTPQTTASAKDQSRYAAESRQATRQATPAPAIQLAPTPPSATPPVRTASAGPVTLPAEREQPKPTSAKSGWSIQIGAFESEKDAKTNLDSARAKARSVLGKADPYTEKVAKGSSSLVRARFAGLDEKSAKEACRLLKRNDFACMTIKN